MNSDEDMTFFDNDNEYQLAVFENTANFLALNTV